MNSEVPFIDPSGDALLRAQQRLAHTVVKRGRVYLADGDVLRIVASVADSDEMLTVVRSVAPIGYETEFSTRSIVGRTVIEGRPIHVEDAHSDQVLAQFPDIRTGGVTPRTRLHVPLRRDGVGIGALAVSRQQVQQTSVVDRPSMFTVSTASPSRAECFAAGTLVVTQQGMRAIETIRVGDVVLSQNVESGELALAPASPKGFRFLSRAQLLKGVVRAYPALANGRYFVRNETQLAAFDLRQ